MGDGSPTLRKVNIGIITVLIVSLVLIVAIRARHAPPTKEHYPSGVVLDIANDQLEDSWLYMNWTAANWTLTLLAAGTAIGAAIKNAFSARNQANAQLASTLEAKANNETPKPIPIQPSGYIDGWVMVLAALTVIATTLSSTIHAGVEADHYRQADLKLQGALMDWKYKNDTDKLMSSWHDAQLIISGIPVTATPQNSLGKDGQPKQATDQSNNSGSKASQPANRSVTRPATK